MRWGGVVSVQYTPKNTKRVPVSVTGVRPWVDPFSGTAKGNTGSRCITVITVAFRVIIKMCGGGEQEVGHRQIYSHCFH